MFPSYDEISQKLLCSKYLKRDKNTLDTISGTPLKKSAATSQYSSIKRSAQAPSRPNVSSPRHSPRPFELNSAKKSAASKSPRKVTKRV